MSNNGSYNGSMNASRRDLLKLSAAGILAGLAGLMRPRLAAAQAVATGQGKKALVVYYSRTGNTREIANQIHRSVGGDIVEIETVNPYPSDYKETTTKAKQELESGYKPPIKTKIATIASYDIVFVGSPIWWGTIATPVMTFLSEHDVSGKTIAPFVTHGGSALGRSVTDVAKFCPQSTILDGLAILGRDAKTSQNDVASWLRKLGMAG